MRFFFLENDCWCGFYSWYCCCSMFIHSIQCFCCIKFNFIALDFIVGPDFLVFHWKHSENVREGERERDIDVHYVCATNKWFQSLHAFDYVALKCCKRSHHLLSHTNFQQKRTHKKDETSQFAFHTWNSLHKNVWKE